MGVPPVLLLRRKIIIKMLTESKAFSEESAVTLEDAGVFNPHAFKRLNAILVDRGVLGVTSDDRYYLK